MAQCSIPGYRYVVNFETLDASPCPFGGAVKGVDGWDTILYKNTTDAAGHIRSQMKLMWDADENLSAKNITAGQHAFLINKSAVPGSTQVVARIDGRKAYVTPATVGGTREIIMVDVPIANDTLFEMISSDSVEADLILNTMSVEDRQSNSPARFFLQSR